MLLKKSLVFVFLFFNLVVAAQVKFCAVGDVLLDRDVRKIIEQNDIFYPFEKIKDIISANDIAFYNNECPFADTSDGFPINKRFSFRAEPEFIAGLKYAGFNVASVANNHTIDYGKTGFMRTIELLNNDSVFTVGGAENQAKAFEPLLIEKNGQTFAFFANLEFLLEGTSFIQNKPYPAYAQIDRLCSQIEKYNSIVDFVIVSFHWGTESATTPNYKQIEYAHKVIDAGADLVIGHHPHVLQSIEVYRNKIILYSLGNFVFDNKQKLQKQSAIFNCVFDNGEIKNPELIPVSIVNNRPQIADKAESKEIFEHLTKISRGFKVTFEQKNKNILINYKSDKTIKEFVHKRLRFYFYADSIFSFDDTYFEKLYKIPDTNFIFRDVCMFPTDSMLYFYSIVENKTNSKKMIAIFPFSLQKYEFARPFLDSHDFYNAWKIDLLDVDNDNVPELIVGVNKSTRYFDKEENRIFVFNVDGTYIYPKWLGSKIGNPIVDFKIDKDKNKLVLLESIDDVYKVFLCEWNGFGFDLDEFLFDVDTNQNEKFMFKYNDLTFHGL